MEAGFLWFVHSETDQLCIGELGYNDGEPDCLDVNKNDEELILREISIEYECSDTGNHYNSLSDCESYCDGECLDNGECHESILEVGVGLSIVENLIPDKFSLSNIYPNPFNPTANITYAIPEYSKVQIIIYDLQGRQIETLINKSQQPGYYSITWNADNHPSGIYFINMIAGDYVNTKKIIQVK